MDATFPDSVRPRARQAVLAALPCQAEPVRTALSLMSGGWSGCLRAMIACSLDESEASLCVGAALDLTHIGLQRLHVMLDAPDSIPALLGTGATVLAGDYLTSGAFKLLLHCSDMQVLDLVSAAITRTSALEASHLGAPVPDLLSQQVAAAERLAPLGHAAGQAGAWLAGHDPALRACAGAFGEQLVVCHALRKLAADPANVDRSAALQALAERAAAGATHSASTLGEACGNRRPLALLAAVLAASAPA